MKAVTQLEFDVSDIPEYMYPSIALAGMRLVESILRMPGGRAMLDAQTAKRKAAQQQQKQP